MTRKQYDKWNKYISKLKGYDDKKIDYSKEYFEENAVKKLERICEEKIRFNTFKSKEYELIPYFEIDKTASFMNPPANVEAIGTLYLLPPCALALMLSKYHIVNELISLGYPLSTRDNYRMLCKLIPEADLDSDVIFEENDRYDAIEFWDDEPWHFVSTVDILSIAIKGMNQDKGTNKELLDGILEKIYSENRIDLYTFAKSVLTEEFQIGKSVTVENAIMYYDKYVINGDATIKEKYDRLFIKMIEDLVITGDAYSRNVVYQNIKSFIDKFFMRIESEKLIEKLFFVLVPRRKKVAGYRSHYNNFAHLLWGVLGECIDEKEKNKSIKNDKVIANLDIILFIVTLYIKRYVVGGNSDELEENYCKIANEFNKNIVGKGIYTWQQIGEKAFYLLVDRGYIKSFGSYSDYINMFMKISGVNVENSIAGLKYKVLNNMLVSLKNTSEHSGADALTWKDPLIELLKSIPENFMVCNKKLTSKEKNEKRYFIKNILPLVSEDAIELCFDKGVFYQSDTNELIHYSIETDQFRCMPYLIALANK